MMDGLPETPEARTASAGAKGIALVVDRDGTSRRFAELALSRAGFAVETAQDAAGAFETLKLELVDLIISDTDLDDMDGLTFFRRLSDEQRLASIPFIFLSADQASSAKVRALRAGVADYLVKPCDVAEFVARAESLVLRQRRAHRRSSARSFSLAGDLSVVSFADIVALLEMTRRSGALSLFTPSGAGGLHFENGRAVHAHCGNLVGPDAFLRLFREPEGHFEFTLDSRPPDARTIHESATALIMEAARISDTEAVARPARPLAPLRPEAQLVPRPSLKPALAPTRALARGFMQGLEDRFTLGDASLWTPESLAAWTRSDAGDERLHVHLVADLSSGVSSLLSLAAAPGERWVMDSLSAVRKLFGVTFLLRQNRILDLILIDAAELGGALLPSLGRTPSLMMICPPNGSLLALGSAERLGLEQLIHTLEPRAILGVGGEDTARGLPQMCSRLSPKSRLECRSGDLSQGREDLRALLREGVRLWAQTG